MGKIKKRKSAQVDRFFKAWREYKSQGGSMTKKEFRDYYRLKVFGKGQDVVQSITEVYDNDSIPGLVNDIFSQFGIDYTGNNDDDITDEDLNTQSQYGLTDSLLLGIPNYITYGLLAYYLYKSK